MTTVFLSGAIEGVPDYGAKWRAIAQADLEDMGYAVNNPFENGFENGKRSVNEVVHYNQYLQDNSDLLLVEYTIADRNYIGTNYEMCRAHDNGQPIIVWTIDKLKERVYLRYLATVTLPTLGECIEYIRNYYPPK